MTMTERNQPKDEAPMTIKCNSRQDSRSSDRSGPLSIGATSDVERRIHFAKQQAKRQESQDSNQ